MFAPRVKHIFSSTNGTVLQYSIGGSRKQQYPTLPPINGYSYPLKSIQMTHLHFGVCLLFSSACDHWLQDATTGHGAPLEEGSAENLVFKADRKAPQSMRYFLMPIRTAQPTLLTLNLWLMKSLRIPATSGLCGVSTKTSNQTFQYRCLNSSSRQKHYPPLKPTMPFPLKGRRRILTSQSTKFINI